MYPKLVRNSNCKIDIIVNEEGLNPDGTNIEVKYESIDAFYVSSSKTIYTDNEKKITLNGKIYIGYDFCPNRFFIYDGFIILHNTKFRIINSRKFLNLDGTINYILLEVY